MDWLSFAVAYVALALAFSSFAYGLGLYAGRWGGES
jgi:hypothetical protein